MRNWAWAAVLAIGFGLLAIGCLLPLVPVFEMEATSEPDVQHLVPTLISYQYRILSVVVCAIDPAWESAGGWTVHEPESPRWPARLLLAAALACVGLVATRRPRAAALTCCVLAVAIGWLFVEARRDVAAATEEPAASGWTAYPPLSAVEVTPSSMLRDLARQGLLPPSWPAWSAIIGGTLVIAASVWLRQDGDGGEGGARSQGLGTCP